MTESNVQLLAIAVFVVVFLLAGYYVAQQIGGAIPSVSASILR